MDDRGFYEGGKGKEEMNSPAEELKSLYRKIVKRLHPDVCPDPTEREKDLLNKANAAYASGDLKTIRRIWGELSGTETPVEQVSDTPKDVPDMEDLLRNLRAQMAAMEEKKKQLSEQIGRTRQKARIFAEHIEKLRKQMKA